MEKVQNGSAGGISCEDGSPWQQIGINQKINTAQDRKTSWKTKCGPAPKKIGNFQNMVGIATKGIIDLKNRYAAQFMFGFQFYNQRDHYNAGRHQAHDKINLYWAPGDERDVEFQNFQLQLYINEEPSGLWELPNVNNSENKNFIHQYQYQMTLAVNFLL